MKTSLSEWCCKLRGLVVPIYPKRHVALGIEGDLFQSRHLPVLEKFPVPSVSPW
jgi:hypothetical protein